MREIFYTTEKWFRRNYEEALVGQLGSCVLKVMNSGIKPKLV